MIYQISHFGPGAIFTSRRLVGGLLKPETRTRSTFLMDRRAEGRLCKFVENILEYPSHEWM
jgi:hypothetical protein